MFDTLKNTFIAAAVAVTSLAAAPIAVQAAPAGAAPAYDSAKVEVNHRRWHRPRHNVRRCNANDAARKAWRMGVNRARVTHVGSRTITVRGRWHGYSVRMVFGRAPGCPVVGRYR